MIGWFLVLVLATESATGLPWVQVLTTQETCSAALVTALAAAQERGQVVLDARCVDARVPALRAIGMEGIER